jgi:branched-chain amino acid transport system permease protein
MGYTGIVVLGVAAFYGIGAYTSAILMTRLGFSFIPAVFAAMAMAFIAGVLIGLPTLRIKGNYLAIVTLGFCEIIRIVELNWVDLTNGPFGIKNIPGPDIFGVNKIFGLSLNKPIAKYYLILLLLTLAVIAVHNMINSRSGRAWRAIKGDAVAAEAMGINVFRYKVFAFAICAALAGLAGAFYASYINYIDSTTFNYNQSIQILSMTIMGGLGSIPGSIVGATFFIVLPEFLRWLGTFLGEWIIEWRQIIYGVILVLMIMFKSNGILGGFDLRQIGLYNRLQGRKKAEVAAK